MQKLAAAWVRGGPLVQASCKGGLGTLKKILCKAENSVVVEDTIYNWAISDIQSAVFHVLLYF